MFDWRILQQKGREQTNKLVIDLGGSMRGGLGVWMERKRKGEIRKPFGCLRIYTYLWIIILINVGRTYVLLNVFIYMYKYFGKRQKILKEQWRWSLPLVLCARAKPSSIRKKSIHTRGNTEDISLCNNPDVQHWSYGNQQNTTNWMLELSPLWPWWILWLWDQNNL